MIDQIIQKTGEKVAIAEQTLDLLDSRIRQLDVDLANFEAILRYFYSSSKNTECLIPYPS